MVHSRVIAAPRELVFKVWTDPRHLPVWFGPDGFKVETQEIDIRGADRDDDPNRFRTIVTFDERSNGKTVVTLRQLHPTKARRDAGIGFGAVEYGYQTLDKLARHVEALRD
ncbi:MAG: SRPBCC domain-containing protein [Parvibaculaceae bacterium]